MAILTNRKNRTALTALFFIFSAGGMLRAQKSPLDHSVYDGWQSIAEAQLSNNGQYVAYNVLPQEGDGILWLQHNNGDTIARINRGYAGRFLPNSTYFICKIKPPFASLRQARIDKKKDDDMPKDSLALVQLVNGSIHKISRVKSFQVSEKEGALLAWLSEKPLPEKEKTDSVTHLRRLTAEADSLMHLSDSLRRKVAEAQSSGLKVLQHRPARNKNSNPEGLTLSIMDLSTGDSTGFYHVKDYAISDKGNTIALVTGRSDTDSLTRVLYYRTGHTDTILQGIQDVKSLCFDDSGRQLAFAADRDSGQNAFRHFYNLFLYDGLSDSARSIADRFAIGRPNNWQISADANLTFSRSGRRLFFGTAPVLPLKDTSLPEFERVHLDIWHYKEDELHTVQLNNLESDLKKSYTAVWDHDSKAIKQLANEDFPRVTLTWEGDGHYFYTTTDTGRRVARQWLGSAPSDIYLIDLANGRKKRIRSNFTGELTPSYTGKYLLMYNSKERNYSLYSADNDKTQTVTGIAFPVYDEDNDVPADPDNYGVMGWTQKDDAVYVYDRYDIWKINPATGIASLVNPSGRKDKTTTRYMSLDKELKYIPIDSMLAYEQYHETTKNNVFVTFSLDAPRKMIPLNLLTDYKYTNLAKAKSADVYLYARQNYQESPNLFVERDSHSLQLSHLNPQQSQYLWGTAELYKWKAYTGKEREGILYKPENFDPGKKYPLIAYFYERNNNTLYNYQPPAPTPSRLNISFFVSRGYVVFVPDIWYRTGHPGASAYDHIVSGVRSLVRQGFIDSTRMGIQGQSWGGYQTAYLITRVPSMFAAAWAGAPVVNMFSAYGGIRWESGRNRQSQYEKTQSRIGYSLWERPELYRENSPLFGLPKVKTPVVIMSNDADGAVPWYQGIEMFTDLRRLGKPAWLLNYNGEAHNLVLRKNRKDIQIREQQFFDWLLKGEKPAPWITEGVPAVMKDKTMGL